MATEYVAGNIYVRQMFFDDKPDMTVDGHAHNFGHVTYIVKGSAEIQLLDDGDNVIKSVIKRATDGFNWVFIEAGKRHRLIAKESGTVGHCLYSHRNPQGDVVVDYDGWTPGYR